MDAPQQPVTDTTAFADQQASQVQQPPQVQQVPEVQPPPQEQPLPREQQLQEHQQSIDNTPSENFRMVSTEETQPKPSYHNGYSSDSYAQYSSRPAEYSMPVRQPTPQDAEQARLTSPPITYQPPPPAMSRPSSGLSSGTERQPTSQQHLEPSQRNPPAKNSVVIKVGMVGDAQIGKTSLMVKYVEGNWDEDYIQTLGELNDPCGDNVTDVGRGQLHGKDDLHPQYGNYLFNLGSWWSAGVC